MCGSEKKSPYIHGPSSVCKWLTIIELHVVGERSHNSLFKCIVSSPNLCVFVLAVCVCSGGGDGRPPAEAQQDLLTVLEGSTVSHTLKGALGLGQQAGTVPGWG